MQRLFRTLALITFLTHAHSGFCAANEASVKKMVEDAAKDIMTDAKTTFENMKAGDAKYVDKDDKGIYVFVYDLDLKVIAHPDKNLIGKDMKNKPDVCGCMFRNEILNRVTGKTEPTKCKNDGEKDSVSYVYKNPEKNRLEHKKTFFKAVKGSDKVEYIVGGGLYVKEMKGCEK